MATVLKRQGRPGWYVKFTDATGRRRRLHVKATSKVEARRIAFELEQKAERQRRGLEPLASDATMTLAKLCRWWLKNHCPTASAEVATLRLERHVCRHELGGVALTQVTTEALEQLLADQRRPDGSAPAPATINRTRTDLHSVLERARRAKLWVGPNPMADVSSRRVPKRAYALLRADEVAVVLRYVPPSWRNLFAAAVWTGMRKGELCGLVKSDVDLRGRNLTVARSYDAATTKGGREAVLPIADELVPYLDDAIRRSPCQWVFPTAGGSMRTRESDPEKVLRAALIRAAQRNPPDARLRAQLGGENTDEAAAIARGLIEGWEHVCRACVAAGRPAAEHTTRHADAEPRRCANVDEKGAACEAKLWPRAVPRQVRFHDLRHTTGTLLLRAGVDPHRVQRILRHSNINVTTGTYAHLVGEDLRAAINTLPAGPTTPAFEELPVAVGAQPLLAGVPRRVPSEKLPLESSGGVLAARGDSKWVQEVSNLRPLPCQGAEARGNVVPSVPGKSSRSEVRGVRAIGSGQAGQAGTPGNSTRGAQAGAQTSERVPLHVLPGRLLTVREVADRLAVSTATVYALIDRAELVHARIGNSIRVESIELERYLAAAQTRGDA